MAMGLDACFDHLKQLDPLMASYYYRITILESCPQVSKVVAAKVNVETSTTTEAFAHGVLHSLL